MDLKTTGRDLTSGDPSSYFTKLPLGRHSFSNIPKIVCSRLDLRDDGAHKIVSTHGLRATIVTLLIDAGYDNATVTLLSEHRDIRSLRNYHGLRRNIGVQQIRRMFGYGNIKNVGGRYAFVNGVYEESCMSRNEFIVDGLDDEKSLQSKDNQNSRTERAKLIGEEIKY